MKKIMPFILVVSFFTLIRPASATVEFKNLLDDSNFERLFNSSYYLKHDCDSTVTVAQEDCRIGKDIQQLTHGGIRLGLLSHNVGIAQQTGGGGSGNGYLAFEYKVQRTSNDGSDQDIFSVSYAKQYEWIYRKIWQKDLDHSTIWKKAKIDLGYVEGQPVVTFQVNNDTVDASKVSLRNVRIVTERTSKVCVTILDENGNVMSDAVVKLRKKNSNQVQQTGRDIVFAEGRIFSDIAPKSFARRFSVKAGGHSYYFTKLIRASRLYDLTYQVQSNTQSLALVTANEPTECGLYYLN